jgi:hypothetical protein
MSNQIFDHFYKMNAFHKRACVANKFTEDFDADTGNRSGRPLQHFLNALTQKICGGASLYTDLKKEKPSNEQARRSCIQAIPFESDTEIISFNFRGEAAVRAVANPHDCAFVAGRSTGNNRRH